MDKNKHILSGAVNDMPLYQPDDSVLQRLESNLFEFPVVNMPNYSPEENLWDRIEGSVKKLDKTRKYWRRSLILTLLLLLGLFFGNMISNQQPNYSDQFNEVNKLNLIAFDNSKDDNESGNYSNTENRTISNEVKENQQYTSRTDFMEDKEENVEDIILINNRSVENPKENYLPKYNINSLDMRSSNMVSSIEDPVFSVDKLSENHSMTDTDCSEFTGPSGYFSVGISGEYNLIREKDDENIIYESDWYVVNAILSYHRNRLYFGTGIGMSFSTDYSDLDYTYLQNELVNTYTNVDSMYYDPITGTTEFYTVIVEVWDSVEYQQQEVIKTEYKYLQIPVFVGYEFLKKPGIGLGFSVGLTYMQIIEQSDNYPTLTIENGRVTDLNYLTPERRKNLLRFDMKLDLRINITQNIYTLISPSASFFNSSIYYGNSLQTTFSPGVRCGLYYTF